MTAYLLPIASAVAATALATAAWSDLRRYLIPNAASLAVVGAALAAAPARPGGDVLAGLAIALLVFAAGAALFARGWTGGGDVKLASAIGLWATPATLSGWALATSLAGAGLAIVMLSPLRATLPAAPHGAAAGLRQPMPYGVALAAGGLWLLAGQVTAL